MITIVSVYLLPVGRISHDPNELQRSFAFPKSTEIITSPAVGKRSIAVGVSVCLSYILVFLTCINELIALLDKIGVKVKADDVKLYVSIVNDIDCDLLQRALDSLQQWANMWQLIISVN